MASTKTAATKRDTSWRSVIALDIGGLLATHPGARSAASRLARALRESLPTVSDASEARQRVYEARLEARHGPRTLNESAFAIVALVDKLAPIFRALQGWSDEDAKQVLLALNRRWRAMQDADHRFSLDLSEVPGWIDGHRDVTDRADALSDLIGLDVPFEVKLEKRLTQKGSQKAVFKATWTVAEDPTNIVFKRLFAEARKNLQRELRPHPLSMRHPNIIETFALPNQAREPEIFLVERELRPLKDENRTTGDADAAQLLLHIGQALAFLEDQGLVHGDLKPDNIGQTDGRYVLLDFGICRPAGDFLVGSVTPTGSLRTRAPEVLTNERKHTAQSDVWALAATIFKLVTGEFPLYKEEDGPLPFLNEPDAERIRAEIIEKLVVRAEPANYKKQLRLLESRVRNRHLRRLLREALDIDADARPRAAEIVREALRHLRPLVGIDGEPPFSPSQELRRIEKFLGSQPVELNLLTLRERLALKGQVEALDRALSARRPYRRAGRRLSDSAYALAIEESGEADARQLAEQVAVLAPEYIDANDREDAERVSHLKALLAESAASEDASPADPADGDLMTALNQLASSAASRRGPLRADAREFKARLGSTV